MERVPTEWRKCYSAKRKRSYYFNQTTGESLWSLEEVMAKVALGKKSAQVTTTTSTAPPPARSESDEPSLKRKNKEKHVNAAASNNQASVAVAAKPATTPQTQQRHTSEVEDVPMEIDEIVENIQRIRSDTATYEKSVSSVKSPAGQLVPSNAKRIEIKQGKQIVVLDTNVLISNLGEISKIGKAKSGGVGGGGGSGEIIFSIPWVVMQELDGLKSRVQANLNKKAQQAILHLNSILKSKTPTTNYIFEDSVQNENSQIKCEKPDDKIIRCALNLKNQYHDFPVTIVTNDVNLINKSLISKVSSMNFESFHQSVSSNNENKHQKTSSKQLCVVIPPTSVSIQKFQELQQRLSDWLYERIDSIIVWTLGYFYEYEMKKAYGDLWYDMAKQKKPWTIFKLVTNLSKTFNAMFCFTANKKHSLDIQNSFKSFKTLVTSSEQQLGKKAPATAVNSSSRLKNLLDLAVEFKTMISKFKTDEYEPMFAKKLASLELSIDYALVYRNSSNCMESFDALSKVNSGNVITAADNDGHNQFETFEKIWTMYHHTSMMSAEIDSNAQNGAACNVELLYHYVICHFSIEYLSSIYESVLTENSEANLSTLCKAIYILCQLFDARSLREATLVPGDEHPKYTKLRRSVQSLLADLSHRQTMSNALVQLKDYQTKFSLLNMNKLNELIKDC